MRRQCFDIRQTLDVEKTDEKPSYFLMCKVLHDVKGL